jgi:hypothetical protein
MLSFKPTNESARDARESLLALADSVETGSLADLRSVVSELVALSVVNGAADPIELRLMLSDGEVLGSIVDSGPVATSTGNGAGPGERSWALQIIDGLVDDWGANATRTGVWFRMPVGRLA